MKKRYLLLLLIVSFIFSIALAACDDSANNGKPSEYTVTFNYNYEGAAVTALATKNGRVQFIADPERDNYEFLGWYLEAECLNKFTAQTVNSNITLYAKWQPKIDDKPVEYSVTFSINGGDGVLPPNASVPEGSDYILPSGEGLSRDGYLFDGWRSGDRVYAAGESVKIYDDVEFSVNWAAATTIVFDLNGGQGTAPQNMTVKSGSEAVLPSGTGISKQGYVFDGWLDQSDELHTAVYTVPTFATVTLRAAWAGEYTFTFVSEGSAKTVKATTGAATVLPSAEVVAGKECTGWLESSSGTVYKEGQSYVCAYRDVTFTAQYKPTLAVTYSDWDGTTLATVSYIEGERITAPDLFITGYAEFAGWDVDLSTITQTTTVTAQYNYTFTDMRYFDLDFSGSYSARYGGYFIRFSDISAALAPLTEVKFPVTWKGSPVIGIYSSGSAPINSEFYRYLTLESVYIPSSFKQLPTYAFYDCSALREVKFSTTCNLTTIGTYAFAGCTALTTFTLPKSVTTLSTTPYGESYTVDNIGSGHQFSGCTALKEFIFEEGSPLTRLAGYMFGDCSSLTKIVNLPSGVTVLPFSMFRNCSSLKSFVIPERITILGGWLFDGCKSLSEIVFEGDNVNAIGQYAFYNTAITELKVPSKVTLIPHNMAYGCTELVKVTVGNRLERIEYEAFGNCPKLAFFNSEEEGLFIMPQSLRYIEAGVFMYAASMKSIRLNEGLLSIGDGAFAAYYRYTDKTKESVGLEEITIPASVTFLGEKLFEADIYLKNITILSENTDFETYDGIMYRKSTNTLAYCPLAKVAATLQIREGTVGLEDFCFASTTGISTIICPRSLKTVGLGAFQLSNITEVVLNEGLEVIGNASFYMLDKLTSVHIPSSVTIIEDDAFRECANLDTLTFASHSRLTTMGRMVFYFTAITTVEIPASVTDMGIGVFQGCKQLKTVTFEEGSNLTYIAQNTFNSTGLESIELPESVTELHYNCLSYNNLTSIDLKNVVFIDRQCFTADKLVSVYIPATVTEMGVHAFSQIETLQSVVFAEDSKLAIINNFAFYGDTALKELTLPASITNINMSAFVDVQLESLTLKSPMVVNVYDNAFGTDVMNAIKKLYVPENLINNYKNNANWSRLSAEILAINS